MLVNYKNFDNKNFHTAYNDFITWLNFALITINSSETFREKTNITGWLDGKIVDKIHTQDKLYKRFKGTFLTFLMKLKKKEHLKLLRKITSPYSKLINIALFYR